MKKFSRIAVTVLVLALTLIGAVPTQASNLSAAQYMRSLTITNSGAETTNNVVTFDPSTLEMINNGLINSSLTGSAITDLANKDLIYMPKEPVRYKLVEYLESDGNQYIDTGYVPNANTKWVANYAYTSAPTNTSQFGLYENSTASGGMVGCCFSVNTSLSAYVVWGSGTISGTSYPSTLNQRLTGIFDNKNENASVQSRVDTTWNTSAGTPTESLYLFVRHNPNASGGYDANNVSVRIYSSQIYDNGVLVRNFVPVERTTDGVLGMFDCVNGVFYPNLGTGTFTTNQYSGTYYVCDYIESDGHQYIDTGFVPSNTSDVIITGMYTATPTGQNYLLANYDSTSGTTNRYYLGSWFTTPKLTNLYGTSTTGVPDYTNFFASTIYTCELNPLHGFGAINNVVATFTPAGGNYTLSLAVNAQKNGANSFSAWGNTRTYSLIMLNNGAIQRNMIPCYDATAQKAGLFDNVNNQMYYSGGSQNYLYSLSGNDGTWCLYLPTVAANTSLQERLYISTENLNSKIAYFPGTSGLVVNRNTSNTVTGSDDWNFIIKGHSISGDGSYLFKYGDDLYATLNGNTITFAYGTITIPTSAVNHNTLWGYYYGTVASGVSFTTSSGSITYNSNNMYKSIGGTTNYAPIRTTLTSNPYNQMIVKASGDYSLRIGYATTNTYDPSNYVTGTNNALTVYSLPTGGTVYPLVTDYKSFSSSQAHAVAAYMIAFTKPDNPAQYGTLTKYGANATAMINNSTNMLKDAAAVITLATKCTGDFMWACVQSSTFTNALNNSPYKDIITSSVDWAKAFAWNTGSYSTTSPNSATVSLSTTQTVPVGYHTYDFRKEGNSISIYVDSNLVRGGIFNETSYYTAITALGYTYSQVASYDTDAQITFAQGGTTLYADQIQQKKNGNNVSQWTWAQTDSFTFPDTSGQGNTGFPSFRETNYGSVNNGANLSVSFGMYQPANVAEYNAPGSGQASTFTGLLPPVEQPTQTVDLGNIKNVPFAEVFEDLLAAGGIPSQLFWLPIMMTLAIAACGVAYHLTRDALISCIAGDVMLGLGCALSLLYTVPLVIGIITTIVLLVKRKTISL